jgi:hypothetical protein
VSRIPAFPYGTKWLAAQALSSLMASMPAA